MPMIASAPVVSSSRDGAGASNHVAARKSGNVASSALSRAT